MPRLFVYPKKGDTFWYPLKKERTSLGRSEDNDITLPDPFSSGHHALIYPSNGGFAVRDNGSKNGTFLNGKKVQGETELKKGDEVLIGSPRILHDKAPSNGVRQAPCAPPAPQGALGSLYGLAPEIPPMDRGVLMLKEGNPPQTIP